MNLKRNIAIAVLCLCGVAASAQQVSKSDPEVVFNHHWFLQIQGGIGYTVGEASFDNFGDLVSGSAGLYAGYRFTPVWGLRFGLAGWQAKGGWVYPTTIYDFNFLQGNVDVMVDLSNWWGGYRHDRFFDAYFFIGPGVNGAFNNDEAVALADKGYELAYLWRDNKVSVAGHAGLGANLRLCDHVAFNIELAANMLTDKFNSKDGDNPDWHFTGMVGFTFSFGKTHKRVAKVEEPAPAPAPAPEPEPEPEPAPAPAPEPVEEVVEAAPASLTENVFFALNSDEIRASEVAKLDGLAAFLKENESASVELCGYADVATGNASYNKKLSKSRAEAVASELEARGISSDRIKVDYKGDTVQPFDDPAQNRVTICIAE